MIDDFNVRQYLPKKCWGKIEMIDLNLDFDNEKNRNVNFYTAYFLDGDRISGVGLKQFVKNVKNYIEMKYT